MDFVFSVLIVMGHADILVIVRTREGRKMEARQQHTDEELKEMAWHFAHDNFTPWGTPKFYDAGIAELLYEMLVKVRDGKVPV